MNTEIISVEAQEIPIEQVVEKSLLTSLEKMDITKKFLEEKRDECLELKLDGQNKEAYTIIRETRLNMKTRRVAIEKICKKGREDATKTQKAWIAVQNDWTGIVSAGEDYLSNLEEEFEKEAERIKNETKRKQEEAFILRQSDLTKMGAHYIDGSFVLNDISFEAILIKEADDEVWNDSIKKKYYDQFLINESARLAEEKIKSEAAEKLRIEQEEFEKQKLELKKAQDELLAQQQEAERLRKIDEKKAEEEAIQQRRNKLSARYDQLFKLGMSFNGQHQCYVFEDVNVDNKTEINLFNDDEWDALINKITPIIQERKDAAEKKRIDALAEEKRLAIEEATRKEKERIEKELADAKLRKEQDDIRKAEELAQSSDKEKWNDFVSQLNKLSIPDMRSGQYRKKIQSVNRLLGEIKGL